MIRADDAVLRLRRDLTLSNALKGLLLAAAIGVLVLEALGWPKGLNASLVLALVGAAWVLLSWRSMKGSRLAADSPLLIASGQFELAEDQIGQALHSFSLFRWTKLRAVHYLAVLRHTQHRWDEAALLCEAILGQRLGPLAGMGRSTRLMLAESQLEMGDLRGAHAALSQLYQQRLPLGEALELLRIQLDYLSRIEAWPTMLEGLSQKMELAELMNSDKSARVQALLALAARETGRTDWARWLSRRAELLAEPAELIAQRPVLSRLWKDDKREEPQREPPHATT